jgi:hypothetical protein
MKGLPIISPIKPTEKMKQIGFDVRRQRVNYITLVKMDGFEIYANYNPVSMPPSIVPLLQV